MGDRYGCVARAMSVLMKLEIFHSSMTTICGRHSLHGAGRDKYQDLWTVDELNDKNWRSVVVGWMDGCLEGCVLDGID